MHKILWGISILLWIATIVVAIILIRENGFLSILPIFSYNKPHGVVGWLFIISLISSVVAGEYRHFSVHKL